MDPLATGIGSRATPLSANGKRGDVRMPAERILVVDDDPRTVDIVKVALEGKGYSVLVASDGREGLDSIRAERPDLVISDVMMPDVNGFELVEQLRADPLIGDIPLIILSVKGEEEDFVKGLELGADDYVAKPFRVEELMARVRANLRRRDGLRQMRISPSEGPFATEGLRHLADLTLDSFVIGTGNRSGYEAAVAAAENPGLRFNPLLLYGGPGLGKTHLMCALANEAHRRNNAIRVLYRTSEMFSQQILDAYRDGRAQQLREDYLGLDLLLVDDIQFLAISPSLQVVAAEILSELYDQGRQIVISSDRRPEELRSLTREISNAFAIGLVVRVDKPDANLRTRILKFKAKQNSWPIDEALLDYLADVVSSDVRTLEGLAKRLVAMKTLAGASLTKGVVDDLVRRTATVDEETTVARHEAPAAVQRLVPPAQPYEPERTVALSEYVNPLAEEFRSGIVVTKAFRTPEEAALVIAETGARPVVVLGDSPALVVDTIQGLVGEQERLPGLPQGEGWVYLAHADTAAPNWILVGTDRRNGDDDLARAIGDAQTPAFLLILNGKGPNVLKARRLVSSVPEHRKMAVVVVVAVDKPTLRKVAGILSKAMRRLFRVPDKTPLRITQAITTMETRSWLRLALEG
jgi:chromosomal replication initiation ATPase DnaA